MVCLHKKMLIYLLTVKKKGRTTKIRISPDLKALELRKRAGRARLSYP